MIMMEVLNLQGVELKEARNDLANNFISYAPSQTEIVNDTIRYNIAFENAKVNKEIHMSYLNEDINSFENKEDELLSHSIANLSGGQQKRLQISRGLYNSPKLIVMDDPFNAIDLEMSKKITDNIIKEYKESIFVLINNQKEILQKIDYIIFLKHDSYIYGTYEEMIKAISSLRKEFKKSVLYLLPILIGMIIAFGIMYFPMKYALLYIPLQTISLFAGLMIGSCPKMITDAKKNGFKMINLISLIVPFVFVLGICFIPDMGDVDLSIDMPIINYLLLFIVGVVASCTLVIPGVSGSMFLLIIGYYHPIFNTISQIKTNPGHSILVLMIFAIGLLVGFFTIAKIMKVLLEKYPRATYWAIVSFVIGSIPAIYISFDYTKAVFNIITVITSSICVVLGIIGSYLVTIVTNKKEKTLSKEGK